MNRALHEHLALQSSVIWSSALTAILVKARKARPCSEIFPDSKNYSTSEYLLGSGNKPYRTFFVTSSLAPFAPRLRVECLHRSAEAEFSARGLSFVPLDDLTCPELYRSIQMASDLIAFDPPLAQSVELLVHSLHILSTDDPAYDTSFSEPTLPFSIFASIAGLETESALRTAESIIHEAMHLQLTLVEQLTPIVNSIENHVHSPWKKENRPVSGLIHAIYVFSVIDQWLELVSTNSLLRIYALRRREQIKHEMSLVNIAECLRGASNIGKIILQKALSRFGYR